MQKLKNCDLKKKSSVCIKQVYFLYFQFHNYALSENVTCFSLLLYFLISSISSLFTLTLTETSGVCRLLVVTNSLWVSCDLLDESLLFSCILFRRSLSGRFPAPCFHCGLLTGGQRHDLSCPAQQLPVSLCRTEFILKCY